MKEPITGVEITYSTGWQTASIAISRGKSFRWRNYLRRPSQASVRRCQCVQLALIERSRDEKEK